MKIKKMYLEDFIKECEELGFEVNYNDETGIYYIAKMYLIIKSWNGKIEIGSRSNFRIEELTNFLKLYKKVQYYIELDEEDKENE